MRAFFHLSVQSKSEQRDELYKCPIQFLSLCLFVDSPAVEKPLWFVMCPYI